MTLANAIASGQLRIEQGDAKCHACGKLTPRGNVTHDGKPWCGCDYRKAIATAGGKGAA